MSSNSIYTRHPNLTFAPAAKKYENHDPKIDGHTARTKTNKPCTPYTYLIGWSELGQWYYGSKYGENSHPSTFWKTYKTSSKYVKQLISIFGDPDIIQIRKVFSDQNSCYDFETKVLTRLDARNNSKWINKHNNITNHYDMSGLKAVYDPNTNKVIHIEECNIAKFIESGMILGHPPKMSVQMSIMLNTVDPETGMKESTRRAYVIAQKKKENGTVESSKAKVKETKSKIGEDGINEYKRTGLKTSKTLNQIDPETGLTLAKKRGMILSDSLNSIDPETGRLGHEIRLDKKINTQIEQNSLAIVIVQIFDANNILQYEIVGRWKSTCTKYKLPRKKFEDSYKNGGMPIHVKGFFGWYAKRITPEEYKNLHK